MDLMITRGSTRQGCPNLHGKAPMATKEDRLRRQETGQEECRYLVKVTQPINSRFGILSQSCLRPYHCLKRYSSETQREAGLSH